MVRWWLEFGWIVSRFCLLWVWVLLAMVGIVGCFFFFFLVVGLLVVLMVDLWVAGGGGVKCV